MNHSKPSVSHLCIKRPEPSECSDFWLLYKRCFKPLILEQFGGWSEIEHSQFFQKKWSETPLMGVYLESRLIGCIGLVREVSHYELKEIQVDPDYQGLSIGSALINQVKRMACKDEIPIRLYVHTSNRAIELYQRLGFTQIGETKYQYRMEFRP